MDKPNIHNIASRISLRRTLRRGWRASTHYRFWQSDCPTISPIPNQPEDALPPGAPAGRSPIQPWRQSLAIDAIKREKTTLEPIGHYLANL